MAGFCFSKRPQTPHSPGAALLPLRSSPFQTLDTPGASAAATLHGWRYQLPKIQWVYPRRFCGAEPPPSPHSADGRQPDLSQNPP